jgi:type VI secretion system secreted protein VgrG
MPLNVTLSFPASAAPAAGLKVRRYELGQAMSEPFELVLEVLSTDPAMAESAVAGQALVAAFADEPFVKEVRGIVRQVEQRTAVPDGDSLYVWTVVPPVWLTTRRRDHRVFQNLSVPDIVAAVVADASYGGRIDPPARLLGSHEPREYVVQYAETDWDFLSRILADEGIASFFDHESGSAWTLIDDTAASAPDLTEGAIPFADPSQMNDPATPHVQTAVVRTCIETSAVTLRDYDFEKPAFKLEARKATDGGATFTNESPLEAYTFEVGKFAVQAPGDARAARVLEADRAARRRVLCAASFTLPPGTRMSMVDHPRDDLDAAFLVVRACTIVDLDRERTHELELMDLAQRFRPALRPKARIHGTQTAFVTASNGEEIDVDNYGRVLIEHPWDRRDAPAGATSRRVRVSQGWAGEGYGFVALPRRGDEVIVAYLDGDPDQPMIVGRVHNAVSTTPLSLPAQKTRSAWRSRSTPGGGGYNEILMDDQAGAEMLSVHAQRDSRHVTERDAETAVGGNETRTVKGNRTQHVMGNQSETVDGDKHIDAGGALDLHGKSVSVASDTTLDLVSAGHMELVCRTNRDDITASNHMVQANVIFLHGDSGVQVVAPKVHVFGGEEIHLQVGGSSIDITAGGIKITSAGDVEVNGGLVKLNCE